MRRITYILLLLAVLLVGFAIGEVRHRADLVADDFVRQWCYWDSQHRVCGAECVFDSDCDDGITCNGIDWCCTWGNVGRGFCEKYHCYSDPGPCGNPIWSVMTVCDCDWDDPCNDVCRPCRADYECDDGCFCNGEERCENGLCLKVVGSRPCVQGETCMEEWMRCESTVPECQRDADCGVEEFCDENGKCQDY